LELTIDVIERARRRLVAHCSAQRLAPDHPVQAQTAHHARDAAPGNIKAFPLHLPPHLAQDAEVPRQ
jgi:hypothetical protein